jgi:hypothetical protein
MSVQIVTKLKKSFQGPHLLGRDELLGLGNSLDSVWQKLERERVTSTEQWIDDEVQRTHLAGWNSFTREMALDRIPYDLRKSEREVVLELSNGSECRAESVDAAINELYESENTPKSFVATIASGQHSLKVELSSGFLGERRVSVEPPSSQLSKEIFVELCAWFDRNKPAAVARTYKALAPIAWSLVIGVAVIFSWQSFAGGGPQFDSEPVADLLVGGISEAEVPRALELLLRSSYELPSPVEGKKALDPSVLLRAYLIAGAIFLVVLTSFVVPDLLLGLGRKGRARLAFSRWWLTYACVGVPALVCTLLFWPLISNAALSMIG